MRISSAQGCEPTCETVCFCRNDKLSHGLCTSQFSSAQPWCWVDAFATFPSHKNITHLWDISKGDSWSALDSVFKTSKVMACSKNAQLFGCQETFTGLPEAIGGAGGRGVDLEVWWKDKKTCMKTSSPKTAGKLPEWGLRFKFHLCDGQMCT